MDRNCGVVEVALKFESGLTDELFVFGLAILRRVLAEISEQADRFEIDVEDGVGVGKQADSVRSGALAEEDGESDGSENKENSEGDPEGTTTMSHG